ncbi:MAG: citrate/2-methylcitrate synthase [Pseudohongiellaceae bacterium]|nr:citrate/2-methylcitrate synthase [Pseudohongiellaceae bacterium]
MSAQFSKGLEGVIADQTAISNVEGDIGRLSYRGYPIEELVTLSFSKVVCLVLFGELPSQEQEQSLERFLQQNGELTKQELTSLQALPRDLHSMRMLQGMIATLDTQVRGQHSLPFSNEEAYNGLVIVAKIPTLLASFYRLQQGDELPSYNADKSYLDNFLSMFQGRDASSEHVRSLEILQILQLEHSFNAGTFTCRVAASTLAPVESAISSAVGALYGKLHGGADEAALNEAIKVGSPQKAKDYVLELLARKGRLMGMGHREYKRLDPRAAILKPMAQELCKGTETENVFLTLKEIETEFNAQMQLKGKEVWANLEFYKGPVNLAVGIPASYFTAGFAMARSVGWLAHFLESRLDNKIMRPSALYVGPEIRSL